MTIAITPGPGLTAAQANANYTALANAIYASCGYYINTQTTSYTLSGNDLVTYRNQPVMINLNCSGANTLTVPTHANVAFPIGTAITVYFSNTGATTIIGSAGVTVNNAPGLPSFAQYSMRQLVQITTDNWALI
jgi:hypothetical protein